MASLEMPIMDLSGPPKAEGEAQAERLCAEEAQRPFDLTRDLLLRARLFRLGAADHILLLTMHHIASDGWSLGLLLRELSALYGAFVEGKPSPLPELPLQYVDFAVWQREWLQGEALEKQLGYWRKQLEGAPAAAGVAYRPPTTGPAELSRRADAVGVAEASFGCARGTEPARRRNVVHDFVGGFPDRCCTVIPAATTSPWDRP